MTLCRVLCGDLDGQPAQLVDLMAASTTLAKLDVDPAERASLRRDLLSAALTRLEQDGLVADQNVQLAGADLTERGLRTGLEETFRTLAKLAPTVGERDELVDQANRHRPRTLT